MGICVSISSNNQESSSSSSSPESIKNNNIRVVHFNGYLDIFEDPTTVGQVLANVPNHFLCTPTQFMLQDSNPLVPDAELALGHIYFLLPYSAFRFEVSPLDLASMSKKLMLIAKMGRSPSGPKGSTHSHIGPDQSSPIRKSRGRGPNRYVGRFKLVEVENVVNLRLSTESTQWKPILSTIRERSFSQGE